MGFVHYNIYIYVYIFLYNMITTILYIICLKCTLYICRCPLLPNAVGLQTSHQLSPCSNSSLLPTLPAPLLKCFMGVSAPSSTVQNVNTARLALSHSLASPCPYPSRTSTPSRCQSSSEEGLAYAQGLALGRLSILTSP